MDLVRRHGFALRPTPRLRTLVAAAEASEEDLLQNLERDPPLFLLPETSYAEEARRDARMAAAVAARYVLTELAGAHEASRLLATEGVDALFTVEVFLEIRDVVADPIVKWRRPAAPASLPERPAEQAPRLRIAAG